jgi:hypothetical protein
MLKMLEQDAFQGAMKELLGFKMELQILKAEWNYAEATPGALFVEMRGLVLMLEWFADS